MPRRLQMINIPDRESPTGALATDLGLQIASFTAGAAIVNAVFTQADFVETLAQGAVFVAGAASLRLVANHAHEFFGHGGRLSRLRLARQGTMVGDLAERIAISNASIRFDLLTAVFQHRQRGHF